MRLNEQQINGRSNSASLSVAYDFPHLRCVASFLLPSPLFIRHLTDQRDLTSTSTPDSLCLRRKFSTGCNIQRIIRTAAREHASNIFDGKDTSRGGQRGTWRTSLTLSLLFWSNFTQSAEETVFNSFCLHLRQTVEYCPAILSYFRCVRHLVMYNMCSDCCDLLRCSKLELSFVQLRLLRRRSTRAASKSKTITVHRIVFTHILNDAPSHAVTVLLRFFPRSESCSTTSSLVLSPSCRQRYILTPHPS